MARERTNHDIEGKLDVASRETLAQHVVSKTPLNLWKAWVSAPFTFPIQYAKTPMQVNGTPYTRTLLRLIPQNLSLVIKSPEGRYKLLQEWLKGILKTGMQRTTTFPTIQLCAYAVFSPTKEYLATLTDNEDVGHIGAYMISVPTTAAAEAVVALPMERALARQSLGKSLVPIIVREANKICWQVSATNYGNLIFANAARNVPTGITFMGGEIESTWPVKPTIAGMFGIVTNPIDRQCNTFNARGAKSPAELVLDAFIRPTRRFGWVRGFAKMFQGASARGAQAFVMSYICEKIGCIYGRLTEDSDYVCDGVGVLVNQECTELSHTDTNKTPDSSNNSVLQETTQTIEDRTLQPTATDTNAEGKKLNTTASTNNIHTAKPTSFQERIKQDSSKKQTGNVR